MFSQVPKADDPVTKHNWLTGYTSQQMKRGKAVMMMGTSEQEIEEQINKELSALGNQRVKALQSPNRGILKSLPFMR